MAPRTGIAHAPVLIRGRVTVATFVREATTNVATAATSILKPVSATARTPA